MCFMLALNFEKQRAGLSMFRSAVPHERGTPTRGWMRRTMSDWKVGETAGWNLRYELAARWDSAPYPRTC